MFIRNVKNFTQHAMRFLLDYEWPGNVRELKNLIEAAFVNLPPKKTTCINLLPQFRLPTQKTGVSSEKERKRIVSVLLTTRWNKSETAKKLHWSRMTLYRKIETYKSDDVRTLCGMEPDNIIIK